MADLAQAQEQSTARGMDFMGLVPLVLVAVVFYFFLIRPQQRREKQRQEMIAALSRGDRVVTNGGLIGTVYRVSDNELVLELTEGVQVSVRKSAISEVLAKIGTTSEAKLATKAEARKSPTASHVKKVEKNKK
ncbi:MAG: preprotein translocase subunit YajC [Holosporales bacterium]|jgi:preprotein translocase subunit YajC|nr:preprotein translocase subunit YajC [Holosporales bacterium]